MANKDNVSFLLGLAMKAGKVKSGEFACINAIRDGTAFLVVLATDASANTSKKISDKCSYYEIPYIIRYTKEELGRIIGKEERSAAAITDKGLADALQEKIAGQND